MSWGGQSTRDDFITHVADNFATFPKKLSGNISRCQLFHYMIWLVFLRQPWCYPNLEIHHHKTKMCVSVPDK